MICFRIDYRAITPASKQQVKELRSTVMRFVADAEEYSEEFCAA
jgi:hypothetical protein